MHHAPLIETTYLYIVARQQIQKSSSKLKPWALSPPTEAITPAFWYSPTRFSKKLVLPCREISSIQSKGLLDPKSFGCPKEASSLSATNSMYRVIISVALPAPPTRNASQMNFRST